MEREENGRSRQNLSSISCQRTKDKRKMNNRHDAIEVDGHYMVMVLRYEIDSDSS